MFKKISTVLAAAALTVATATVAAQMSEGHPDSYVVRKGDTLWDISAKFLKRPWLWPEIWQANPQIKNPHLIYPGDVVSLAYLDRVAVQPGSRQDAPVNGVPLSDVEPFLKNLRVVDGYEHLPRVVGFEDNRLRAAGGQLVYVLGQNTAQPGERYALLRPTLRYTQTRVNSSGEYLAYREDLDYRGKRLKGVTADAERGWSTSALAEGPLELLGYEMKQVAVGTVTRGRLTSSDTITLQLEGNGFEARIGDRIVPVEAQPYDLQFFPHAPRSSLPAGKLQIAAVADAYLAAGPRDVVAISGGIRDGIDNGTVFSVWRQGSHVKDRLRHPESSVIDDAKYDGAGRITLPDEYAAHVMVFRAFDKVSYALVMEGTKPAKVGYELKHPDATY
ncbi:MAG: LysM domain-containing protein [Pseudoxanthomonas sp.]